MKRILITGGSGFIGSNLINRLLKDKDYKNYEVYVLVRDRNRLSKTRILSKTKIKELRIITADITNIDSLKSLRNINFDYVIHTAGLLGGKSSDKKEYEMVNFVGTKNILRITARAKNSNKNNLKLFIHFSSAGVVGPTTKKPVDENQPYNPTNIYEETKAKAEKYTIKYCTERGISLCILRPSIVFGPGDKHLLPLFKMATKRFQVVINGANSKLSFLYVEDLVNTISLIIKNNIQGVYFVSSWNVKLKEFMMKVSKEYAVQPRIINIPYHIALFFAHLNGITKFFGIKPFLTESRVRLFVEDRLFNTKKIKSKGFKTKYTLKNAVHKTLTWYKRENLL